MPRIADSDPLRDVCDFLFDLDGCVWFGDTLAPDAADLIADLRAAGAKLGFLTNTSSTDAAGVAAKLRRLGIPAAADDVVTPMSVLMDHEAFRAPRRVLAVATDEVADILRARGVQVVDDPARAEVVVVGKDTALTYQDLADATQALVDGAQLIALNLDASVPAEDDRTLPGAGAIAAALVTASGVQAQLVGKPSRAFFDHAVAHFEMDRARTVMVGDRADVDVRGGRAAGLKTVLVGKTTGGGSDGDAPDLRIDALGDLRARLRGL